MHAIKASVIAMALRCIPLLLLFTAACTSGNEKKGRDGRYDPVNFTMTDMPSVQGDFILFSLKRSDTDELIPLCIPLYRTAAYEAYEKSQSDSPNRIRYVDHADSVDVVVKIPYSFEGCTMQEPPEVAVKLGPANRGVRPSIVEILGRRFSFEESMASFLYYFNLTSTRLPYRIRLEPAVKEKGMFTF